MPHVEPNVTSSISRAAEIPSSWDRISRSPLQIAVIGTGISGMSAAWLLSQKHQVTVFEAANIGGHSHTVDVASASAAGTPSRGTADLPVDMGFIVYNEPCYPNLTALFQHLDVPTQASDMSLSVSFDDGALEYGGDTINTLFAQRRNLLSPSFWSMLRDLMRFYREAPRHLGRFAEMSIGEWLRTQGYGNAFLHHHLLPMAAAIWSAPAAQLLDYPAQAFVTFCENHGLLQLRDRPQWRTVRGGSREYVKRLTAAYGNRIALRGAAVRVSRHDFARTGKVWVQGSDGQNAAYDAVVMAAHADESLALLDDPDDAESRQLGAFGYAQNRVVLHGDQALMPKRRAIWSSWNYLGRRARIGADPADIDQPQTVSLTYWMNRLQHLDPTHPLFVTLNPQRGPRDALIYHERQFSHPIFNQATARAQSQLWSLQGLRGTWYCGAYFGAGFHEDGLQAGLALAEQLGRMRRPWIVANESGRIQLGPIPKSGRQWPTDHAAVPAAVPAAVGVVDAVIS
ncbi:FAD-dependent oxidoreductase [Robbsia sp. KACC 23696]|uniref:NAD(P)/FAD-dependent oxidoreductase n=1 Tax=Robbsia sp. KACC 23696 TaxID=3149231 RepID=UPI00325A978B